MTKFLTLAAVALAGVVLSPAAMAREPKAEPAAASTTNADAQPKADTRYCIVDTVTGSRIPQKVCKTRQQWMAEGFDPLNP